MSSKKIDKVKDKIEEMRQAKTMHGQKLKVIGKLAKDESKSLKSRDPAEVIITTVLSMNQKWQETAEPRLINFKKNYGKVKTLSDLKHLSSSMSEKEFCEKVLGLKITRAGFWRYKMMNDLIVGFERYLRLSGLRDDWLAMQDWAKNVKTNDLENDIVGRVSNVGLATVQNIRLLCGIDTVKPDVHVKNSLKEVGLGNEIEVVELLSELTGYSAREIDQIFWYWDKNKNSNTKSNIH